MNNNNNNTSKIAARLIDFFARHHVCFFFVFFINVTYVTQCYESNIVLLFNAGKHQSTRRQNVNVFRSWQRMFPDAINFASIFLDS